MQDSTPKPTPDTVAPDLAPTGGAVPGIDDHPLREQLTDEVHARPYEMLPAPAQGSFVALFSGEEAAEPDRQCVAALCRRYGVAPPPPGSIHFTADLGPFRLRWERHTEFSSYGFLRTGDVAEPFVEPVLRLVPADWLAGLVGETLVAVHVAVEDRRGGPRELTELGPLFDGRTVAGSTVAGGGAKAWTDFRVHADGFSRILVENLSLRSRQLGRLAQRLVEIETYRMMALLAFPEARRYGRELTRLDQQLAGLTEEMPVIQGLADEQRVLGDLSRLAAEVERIAAATDYRLSAARAYYALVDRRIVELRERRVEGIQTFREFMERRLAPAMRTCEAVGERLESLSTRVARSGDLLRARVSLALERQNQDLLQSMDRRARLQLRLQETVEGLSVVVLSYYSVSLVGYALKALKAGGLHIDVELLTGVAIPFVVGAVFMGIRWLRRRLAREAH